jgi:hypothetical protein
MENNRIQISGIFLMFPIQSARSMGQGQQQFHLDSECSATGPEIKCLTDSLLSSFSAAASENNNTQHGNVRSITGGNINGEHYF